MRVESIMNLHSVSKLISNRVCCTTENKPQFFPNISVHLLYFEPKQPVVFSSVFPGVVSRLSDVFPFQILVHVPQVQTTMRCLITTPLL